MKKSLWIALGVAAVGGVIALIATLRKRAGGGGGGGAAEPLSVYDALHAESTNAVVEVQGIYAGTSFRTVVEDPPSVGAWVIVGDDLEGGGLPVGMYVDGPAPSSADLGRSVQVSGVLMETPEGVRYLHQGGGFAS